VLPRICEYFCSNCAGGHDTATLVLPEWDLGVVREAFEDIFNGDFSKISCILGWQKGPTRIEDTKNNITEKVDVFVKTEGIEQRDSVTRDHSELITLEDNNDSYQRDQGSRSDIQVTEPVLMIEHSPQNLDLEAQGTISEVNDSVFPCFKCEKTFETRRKTTRHIREVHKSGQKRIVYACDSGNCGAVYTNKRDMKFCPCQTKKRDRKQVNIGDPWNKCSYECEMCKKTFLDRKTLKSHVVNKHQMDFLSSYIITFGDPDVSNPKWSCQLCTSSVRFDRRSISSHLAQHSLDLTEYEKHYGGPETE